MFFFSHGTIKQIEGTWKLWVWCSLIDFKGTVGFREGICAPLLFYFRLVLRLCTAHTWTSSSLSTWMDYWRNQPGVCDQGTIGPGRLYEGTVDVRKSKNYKETAILDTKPVNITTKKHDGHRDGYKEAQNDHKDHDQRLLSHHISSDHTDTYMFGNFKNSTTLCDGNKAPLRWHALKYTTILAVYISPHPRACGFVR